MNQTCTSAHQMRRTLSGMRPIRTRRGGWNSPRRPLLGDRVELVSAADHRTHYVRDAEYGEALAARTGYYRAVCGHTVWPCSLFAPPGKLCPACAATS